VLRKQQIPIASKNAEAKRINKIQFFGAYIDEKPFEQYKGISKL
jgi:hypothetical protein